MDAWRRALVNHYDVGYHLRVFVDLNPAFENAVERVASFLARDDADDPES